jgi:hypothetical protein
MLLLLLLLLLSFSGKVKTYDLRNVKVRVHKHGQTSGGVSFDSWRRY